MQPDFDDPHAFVPQQLSDQESRAYEERTVDALRQHVLGSTAGPVIVDEIELVGSRPETLVVVRYHHHPACVGRQADLVEGPRAEAARLWQFAIDPDDQDSAGIIDSPQVLAAAIGSAFDAAAHRRGGALHVHFEYLGLWGFRSTETERGGPGVRAP